MKKTDEFYQKIRDLQHQVGISKGKKHEEMKDSHLDLIHSAIVFGILNGQAWAFEDVHRKLSDILEGEE